MALRLAVSLLLLVVVWWSVDTDEVVSHLRAMRPGWVVVALAISVVQVAGSAWRWRFTATRLGIALPLATAIREYYLATFLNQVLPGGVTGDVSRAWRHVHTLAPASPGRVIRAVVLERASGQIVMTVVALISVISLSATWSVAPPLVIAAAGFALALAVLLVRWVWRHEPSRQSIAADIVRDARVALFTGHTFIIQTASSLVVVASYLATFLVAARAVGVDTPWMTLLPLVAPVLVAMLVPVTVAGWGIREGAAAALWTSVGLTPAEGVAVSVSYGLLVLLGSVPGAVVLLWPAARRRSRSNSMSSPRRK